MTSPDVEAVARALLEEDLMPGAWDRVLPIDREIASKRAQAAIAALRERGWTGPEDGWRDIISAPRDGTLILACRQSDGAMMIWRGDILARNLAGPTPKHLSFAATHWRPLPPPPKEPDHD